MEKELDLIKCIKFACLTGAATILSLPAIAVEPAAVEVGAVDIFPQLTLATSYDDNFLQDSDIELDTFVTTINPAFNAVAQRGSDTYSVSYQLVQGLVSASSDDNYLDHDFDIGTKQVLNSRNEISFGIGYAEGHEPRGTGLTRGNPLAVEAPIEFHTDSFYGSYGYGVDGAKGNLNFSVNFSDTVYDNVRELTAGRDNESLSLGAEFKYKIGARTRAVFEYRNRELDYVLDSTPQDNTDQRVLIGGEWDATGKISGSARAGWAQKDFDNSSLTDASRFTWEVGLNYAWKTYSSFDISTKREPTETSGVGNFIDNESYRLAWNHKWLERLSSVVSIGYADAEYDGIDIQDETINFNASATYNMRRWFDLRVDFRSTDVDSTAASNNFDQLITSITAVLSL